MSSNTHKEDTKTVQPDFGAGSYSSLMVGCYETMTQAFNVLNGPAEKIARQIGSEYGAAMKQGNTTASIGKVGKDKVTLSEARQVKGISPTFNLRIMRACQVARNAGKEGLSYANTEWRFAQDISEYVNGVTADVARTNTEKLEKAA